MKVYTTLAIMALASQAAAFPAMAKEYAERSAAQEKRQLPGITPGFNAKAQRIDVSGTHTFVAPGHDDQRGPCPGLNALANHNYLPHNGVATITQFISATNSVFGMGLDLATFLSTYGAVVDGNLVSWSIGGPTDALPAPLMNLLSQPQGISFSHNKYETDGSPTRGDYYLYRGDAATVQLNQFKDLYSTQSGPNANYNLDILTDFRAKRVAQSIATNPYYFSAPFAGVLVQPAAYTFIYRFMSNKSAEHPSGVLNRDVLKSFFAISGPDDALVYTAGHERIPENWYKRAIGDEYTIPYFALDVAAAARKYPQFLEIGGNTGTVNSFAGVNPADLSGELYNLQNLAQGNNAACFAFQAAQQGAPDLLKGLLGGVVDQALSTVTRIVGDATSVLGCPQLASGFDAGRLEKFPGFSKLKVDGTY